MKKIIGLFFVAIAALSLAACGKKKEVDATGYGLVHKHYVAEVTVKVKGDEILEMNFEEYFLPYNFGEVTNAFEGDLPENVIKVGNKNYAKFVSVDGVIYTATNVSNAISYVNKDNVDIEVVVKDETAAKAYVEAAKAKKAFIVDSKEGTTASTILTSKVTAFDKTTANYWPAGGNGLGWKKNMEELSKAFINFGVDAEFTRIADGDNKNKWETVDGVSGATVSDFLDYQAVAIRAVNNAK